MLLEAVRRFFAEHGIEPCRIVAAVSGGVDSTALLITLTTLRDDGFEIICGHVNHHIRGVEADDDESYVRELCVRLRVPLWVADGSLDPDLVRRVGVEAAAREVRTAKLQEIALTTRARFIATAHQKNDQAESILMRLMTGTGIAGLRGIHPVRGDGFIRPLLEVSRPEIEAFLQARGITPRFDRMNADTRYLRVRVRRALASFDAATIDNLAAVAAQARDQWAALERLIDEADARFTRASPQQTRFEAWPEDTWLKQALLHRHIQRLDPTREISAADLTRIAAGLDAIKRLTVTRSLELVRRGEELVLRRIPRPAETFELALRPGEEVRIPEASAAMSIRRIANTTTVASEDRTTQVVQLPSGADPLFTVRNRRNGDRFLPLGLAGEKKLKDFLIDRKVPAEARDRIPLVLWKGAIVWVAGVEVAEPFKVTRGDGDLYELTFRHDPH